METRQTWLRAALRRIERGERWWAAEAALRGVGLLLLVLCALAVWRLHLSMTRPVPHAARPLDYPLAASAVVCWWFGWAFAAEGPALFKLVPLPARSWLPGRRET